VRFLVWAARSLLIGAALIYCIVVVALGLLWTFQTQQIWWLELSRIFSLFLFAPLVLCLPAALLIRSRWLRSAAALAMMMFLALFGGRLVPPFRQAATGIPIRILTINQLYTNDRTADLIAAIRAQQADIVAIQELTPELASAAKQQLFEQYPYQALTPGDTDLGLGVLSRYPIRLAEREQEYSAQRMLVHVDGQDITLINVHPRAPQVATRRLRQFRPVKVVLNYDTTLRGRELPRLLGTIDTIDGPLIVVGDFNTSDREQPYAELAARLHDAFGETGWGFGFTFPNDNELARMRVPFPLVRIDYIWSRGGILPAAARVICDFGGSDHCAVTADLVLDMPEGR
jgi:endonuclease/exonuclease/phosphatase (EEP) superfamily protein YafD